MVPTGRLLQVDASFQSVSDADINPHPKRSARDLDRNSRRSKTLNVIMVAAISAIGLISKAMEAIEK